MSWEYLSILGISQLLLPNFDETLKVPFWEHLEQIPTIKLTFVQATFVPTTFIQNKYLNLKGLILALDLLNSALKCLRILCVLYICDLKQNTVVY